MKEKIDPYNYERRYLNWKEKTQIAIPEVNSEDSAIIKQYLNDMEAGINIASGSIKGKRSYLRLNALKDRLVWFSRLFWEQYHLDKITSISEEQLLTFFSNLETGQLSTIDAKISLELITEASRRIVPHAENLLDIGCGAGNYTLMMLSKLQNLSCTLVDLSKPMLDKAYERVSVETNGKVDVIQGDIREVKLQENHFDIILAGAV